MTTTPGPEPDPPPAVGSESLLHGIPDARPAYFPDTDQWWPDDS